MNKLKTFAVTAVAAVTIGTGALATAPSASAQKARQIDCDSLLFASRAYHRLGQVLYDAGGTQNVIRANYYFGMSVAYTEMWGDQCN